MMDNIPEDRTTHLLVGGAMFLGLFALLILSSIVLRQITGIYLLGTVVNLVGGFLLGQRAARWYMSLPPRFPRQQTRDDWPNWR
jgi:hypothetical protein